MPSLRLDGEGRLQLQNKCDPEHHDMTELASVVTGTVQCVSNLYVVKFKKAISNLATINTGTPNGNKQA
jgi:hypothetical protein